MRLRRQRGQALFELAIIFPVLLLMALGGYTVASAISDNDTAAQVTGYGARIGAEIGNGCNVVDGSLTCTQASGSCQEAANDPCVADQQILSAVTPALNNQLTNATVTQIDIYQPGNCTPTGGQLPALSSCPAADGNLSNATLIDEYQYCSSSTSWVLINGNGATGNCNGIASNIGGVGQYTLTNRTQTSLAEQAIGVAITFQFTSNQLPFLSYSYTAYTAITFPPQGS